MVATGRPERPRPEGKRPVTSLRVTEEWLEVAADRVIW